MGRIGGDQREYLSFDTVDCADGCMYPTEFLNSLVLSGMAPHRLLLKVGCPLILVRNLQPAQGLCNGTRLRCVALERYSLFFLILFKSITLSWCL